MSVASPLHSERLKALGASTAYAFDYSQTYDAAAGYNAVAASYDTSPWSKFWDRNEVPLARTFLSQHAPYESALDVGSGTGRYLEILSEFTDQTVGVDPSIEMLRYSKIRNKSATHVQMSLAEYPSNRKFNAIVMARVLSHISDPIAAVRKLTLELLEKGGVIFISDLHPNHNYRETAFEVNGKKLFIETYRHDIKSVFENTNSINWKYQEFKYEDLLWKPQANKFSTIIPRSGRPIFYTMTGVRK